MPLKSSPEPRTHTHRAPAGRRIGHRLVDALPCAAHWRRHRSGVRATASQKGAACGAAEAEGACCGHAPLQSPRCWSAWRPQWCQTACASPCSGAFHAPARPASQPPPNPAARACGHATLSVEVNTWPGGVNAVWDEVPRQGMLPDPHDPTPSPVTQGSDLERRMLTLTLSRPHHTRIARRNHRDFHAPTAQTLHLNGLLTPDSE